MWLAEQVAWPDLLLCKTGLIVFGANSVFLVQYFHSQQWPTRRLEVVKRAKASLEGLDARWLNPLNVILFIDNRPDDQDDVEEFIRTMPKSSVG